MSKTDQFSQVLSHTLLSTVTVITLIIYIKNLKVSPTHIHCVIAHIWLDFGYLMDKRQLPPEKNQSAVSFETNRVARKIKKKKMFLLTNYKALWSNKVINFICISLQSATVKGCRLCKLILDLPAVGSHPIFLTYICIHT